MEPEFWHSRWREGQIGFHRPAVHEQLRRYQNELLQKNPHPRVLVPLCGKSLDLEFLATLGGEAIGIELSPLAAQSFFQERDITPAVSRHNKFEKYSNGNVTILCGDFFDATLQDVGTLDAAYDRAALVALPPSLRARYVERMAQLLPAGTPLLLISFDYPEGAMSGPPFSVPKREVESLFAAQFDIAELGVRDVLDDNARFKEHLSNLAEQTYLLRRRA